MTDKQLHMMKHAWGFDSKEPGFRDHYCTHTTDEDMVALIRAGMFDGPYYGEYGAGCAMFYLTQPAIEKLQSLKYVEMTTKKKRKKA